MLTLITFLLLPVTSIQNLRNPDGVKENKKDTIQLKKYPRRKCWENENLEEEKVGLMKVVMLQLKPSTSYRTVLQERSTGGAVEEYKIEERRKQNTKEKRVEEEENWRKLI